MDITKELIKKRIRENLDVKELMLSDEIILEQIFTISESIISGLKENKKILFAGNGGSFSDSLHLTTEFVSRFMIDREPMSAICLGANNSIITAIGNDYIFDDIFVRELKALGRSGDIFIVLSTSGNSKNILKAVKVAIDLGIIVFGMTGVSGGKLLDLCHCVRIPSESTPRVQEAHIMVGHIICEIVENALEKIKEGRN